MATKKEPKYAPAREDGLKPWVVERHEWGHKSERIHHAKSASAAEYDAVGRQRHVSAKARRATPEDMRNLPQ